MPAPALGVLRDRLDAAVRLGNPAAITQQVKRALQDAIREKTLDLPAAYRQPRPETYARRLLHRDPDGLYTAVVMTWGPGQGTALHDHAGIWCVECVVEDEMEVQQYDLVDQTAETYRFAPQTSIHAGPGSAGCLIPPFEYHTLANRGSNSLAVTLHVYGGELTCCHAFEPQPDGTYRRVERQLSYHH